MRRLTFGLLALLIVLHHDFWFWDTYEPLVFGFLPIGLAYHAGVSIAAAGLWALAVRHCWPDDLDLPDEDLPDAALPDEDPAAGATGRRR